MSWAVSRALGPEVQGRALRALLEIYNSPERPSRIGSFCAGLARFEVPPVYRTVSTRRFVAIAASNLNSCRIFVLRHFAPRERVNL